MLVAEGARMVLCARPYARIRGAWRVAPYQDARSLVRDLLGSGLAALSATAVGAGGEPRAFLPDSEFQWLLAGGEGRPS